MPSSGQVQQKQFSATSDVNMVMRTRKNFTAVLECVKKIESNS